MASPLHLMRRGVRGMDLGHGLMGYGLNAGAALLTGYGVGQVNQRFAGKWVGENAARITAIAGKAGAVIASLLLGPGMASGAVDTVGNVGLGLVGAHYGLKHGAESKGQELRVVAKGTSAGRQVHLGALPPAQAGPAMSWDQVAEMCQYS